MIKIEWLHAYGREFINNKIKIIVYKRSINWYGGWKDSKMYDAALMSIEILLMITIFKFKLNWN